MNEEKLTTTSLISQNEAAKDSWKRFKYNREREWGLAGHDIGIHPLNLTIGGWLPQKVTTVAGRSGMGKTALVVPMVKAGARLLNGRRAEFLFFSWEMGPGYMVDRSICHDTGLTLRMLTQGAKLLTPNTLKRVEDAYVLASRLPVQYQLFSTNIDTVKALIFKFVEECQKKEEIEGVKIQPVVIVDYIGMAQFEGAGLRTYGISDFMNGLKQACNVSGASGLVFAQINRSADEKAAPDKSDLSDSQAIEMASDNLLIVHRPEHNGIKTMFDPKAGIEIPSEGKMLVRQVKGRDYGTGDYIINSDVKHFRFYDMEDAWDFPYWERYKDQEFWLKHFGLNKIQSEQLEIV
jgi:replicative DNA helicase